jgi:FHS family L-fucose permease-like MFS transporter
MATQETKASLFTLDGGSNLAFTFILVSSLFLLCYFFMSIMFPTIFALGIHGLGVWAKKASSFIVMAIMGGAVLPKLMGYVADRSDISRGFIVPLFCFVLVACYGLSWARLSKAESLGQTGPARNQRETA